MHLQEISQEPTYLEQQSDSIVDLTFVLCDAIPVLKNISRCLWSWKTVGKKEYLCLYCNFHLKKNKPNLQFFLY